MPEDELSPFMAILQANAVAKRKAKVMAAANYILRAWIAQTPGALPAFATDQAAAAMAVAEAYVDAGDAMVVQAAPEEPIV